MEVPQAPQPRSPEQSPVTPTRAAGSFLERVDRKIAIFTVKWQPVIQAAFGLNMIFATEKAITSLSKGDTAGATEFGIYAALSLLGSINAAMDSRRAYKNAELTIQEQQQMIQTLQESNQPK